MINITSVIPAKTGIQTKQQKQKDCHRERAKASVAISDDATNEIARLAGEAGFVEDSSK